MKPVAIIGGGISGLSAAYFVSRTGRPCVLIEAQPQLGGVIRTEQVDGCVIEAGPDSFIAEKPWAMELIRELGIEDSVIGSNDKSRRTYICRSGRLVALPDGIQFLAPTKLLPMATTSLFSWKAKATMALEWFRRPPKTHVERSVAQFVTDHYGREVNEYLAQPMLAGVYGGTPETLSVDSVLPRFVELERRYGSLTRGVLRSRKARQQQMQGNPRDGKPRSLFLSLRGGMQQLTDALVERIEGKVERLTGTVQAVEGGAGDFRLRMGAESLAAEQVIVATPAYRAAELIRGLDSRLSELLAAIPYTSSITAALLYERAGFDHPLDGFGVLVPRAERRRLTACTWVNTKFPERVGSDRVLLRGFLAAEQAEDLAGASDDEVAHSVQQELSALMGFRQPPIAWRVHRWQRAMAQYEVGHQSRLDEIEQRVGRLPGLYLTGNAYTGIGIPDCIRRSRTAVERMQAEVAV